MELTNEYLINYKNTGFYPIQGWVYDRLFDILQVMDNLPFNKKGGICEIGVHHGKFYLMLNQLVDAEYKSYAVDIFNDQHLNINHSGNGSLEVFQYHLSLFDRHRGQNTICIQGDSADTTLDLVNTIGRGTMKVVSVDGSHTREHALNDIKISSEIVRNEGMVIVDDILHPYGLGPLEATFYWLNSYPTLVPFAMGCNKLFMCKITYYQLYYDAFINSPVSLGPGIFFGHNIVHFGLMEPIP